MGNSINLSILLPLIPLGTNLFILILLISFNRTLNRLTMPVSYLSILSILSSSLLSFLFLLNHVEGIVPLSDYFSIFQDFNLDIHINNLIEKIIIIFGIGASLLIGISLSKLPRKRGYVLYVLNIGLSTSLIFGLLLFFEIPI